MYLGTIDPERRGELWGGDRASSWWGVVEWRRRGSIGVGGLGFLLFRVVDRRRGAGAPPLLPRLPHLVDHRVRLVVRGAGD